MCALASWLTLSRPRTDCRRGKQPAVGCSCAAACGFSCHFLSIPACTAHLVCACARRSGSAGCSSSQTKVTCQARSWLFIVFYSFYAERAPYIRLGGGRLLLCTCLYWLPDAPGDWYVPLPSEISYHVDPCSSRCCPIFIQCGRWPCVQTQSCVPLFAPALQGGRIIPGGTAPHVRHALPTLTLPCFGSFDQQSKPFACGEAVCFAHRP
jgi:hypothetical protein